MSVACWCGSLGILQLAHRRVFVPEEAKDDKVYRWLPDMHEYQMPANHLFGILFSGSASMKPTQVAA
eukprot:12891932-Prorocentrum_lima.AAC.1